MEVWVLEWSYPCDMETNVTLYASQEDAYKHACKEIHNIISSDWDMDDEHQKDAAELFDANLSSKKYELAINVWHEYQNDYNDEYAQYWTVYSRPVIGEELIGEVVLSKPVYKATSSGATCRGPCGNYNEYAYADQSDGTHVCYQCSTFKHIFGTNP